MTEVGISELRRHLSRYLQRVRGGEHIIATRRGTAVARIVPVAELRPYDRLVDGGIIEPSDSSQRTRPGTRFMPERSAQELVEYQGR